MLKQTLPENAYPLILLPPSGLLCKIAIKVFFLEVNIEKCPALSGFQHACIGKGDHLGPFGGMLGQLRNPIPVRMVLHGTGAPPFF